VVYSTGLGLASSELGVGVLDRLMTRRDAVCFSSDSCTGTGKVLSEVSVVS